MWFIIVGNLESPTHMKMLHNCLICAYFRCHARVCGCVMLESYVLFFVGGSEQLFQWCGFVLFAAYELLKPDISYASGFSFCALGHILHESWADSLSLSVLLYYSSPLFHAAPSLFRIFILPLAVVSICIVEQRLHIWRGMNSPFINSYAFWLSRQNSSSHSTELMQGTTHELGPASLFSCIGLTSGSVASHPANYGIFADLIVYSFTEYSIQGEYKR